MAQQDDARSYSPAFERNREPMTRALMTLPLCGERVLEVGSGVGQHVCHFARHVRREDGGHYLWQPTEQAEQLESILAWRAHEEVSQWVEEPEVIDLLTSGWERAVMGGAPYAMVMSMNVIHIVAWEGVVHLVEGASRCVEAGGVLCFYGPFRSRHRELEPSNAAFEVWLKERFEGGGLRVSEEVAELARANGFEFCEDREMPANNRLLFFKKQ